MTLAHDPYEERENHLLSEIFTYRHSAPRQFNAAQLFRRKAEELERTAARSKATLEHLEAALVDLRRRREEGLPLPTEETTPFQLVESGGRAGGQSDE